MHCLIWDRLLLYRNLVTLMLWYRYSLDCSNPSKFSLEKWRKKLTPCNFSLFWAGNAPLPLEKRVTQVITTLYTWEKSGATTLALTVGSGSPLAPPVCFIGGAVLEFSRKKGSFERILEAHRRGASSLWFRNQLELKIIPFRILSPPHPWYPQPYLSSHAFKY